MCAWSVCYSGSNNAHFQYPPIMADGRNYATWQPEAVINSRIRKEENIHSNWHYRLYLQQHGTKIMNYNSAEACHMLGLPCSQSETHQTNAIGTTEMNPNHKTPADNVPFRFRNVFDTNRPGFGYCNSNLKNPYVSREQLNARMVAPTVHYPN